MYIQRKNYPRPVMAVLVGSITIASMRKQSVRPQIRLMVEANKEVNTTLYYFSLNQVKLRECKITGYYWHNRYKRWQRQDFMLPDILYIRDGIDRRYTHTFTGLCNMINKRNGKLITHRRFDKWRLYQIMNKDPVMKKYLPVTRAVKRSDDIKNILQDYKVVYLKSLLGRKGENVLRVEALPDGNYRYSYYRHGLLTVKSVAGFQALLDVVNKFFQGKSFLAQQAIQLLKFKNRLIDMRAELQRNGGGGLEVVGISVRYGRPGSPVTTHGDAYKFDDFFTKKMGYTEVKLEALRSAVHEFLFSAYEYIDNNYGEYAEMGIDFAIDTNGRIWFIEANAQSTKVSLNKAYGKTVLLKNHKNILEYSRYLFDRSRRGVSD